MKLLAFIILLFVLSCADENPHNNFYQKTVELSFDKAIEKDPHLIRSSLDVNSPFLVYVIDREDNTLNVLNFEQKTMKSLPLPFTYDKYEHDFKVYGPDSIFVCTQDSLMWYNRHLSLIKSWEILLDSNKNIGSYYSEPFYISDSSLILSTYPKGNYSNLNYKKKYHELGIDFIGQIQKNTIRELGYVGREINRNWKYNTYYTLNANRLFVKHKLYYSLAHNSMLQVRDLQDNNTEVALNSKYFIENTLFDESQIANRQYVSKYYIENARYELLKYNQFTKQFYRICKKKDVFENKDGSIKTWKDVEWSIIVADSNLRTIYEIDFPSNEYDRRCLLFNKNEVWILKNSVNNTKIEFDVFIF